MYYEIDFADRRQGLYTLNIIKKGELVPDGVGNIRPKTMLTTDPDIEAYAGLMDTKYWGDYMTVLIDHVHKGIMSVEILRSTKHLCLFNGWEIPVLLKKVHPTCFEFSFSGGRLFVTQFGLGEPLE